MQPQGALGRVMYYEGRQWQQGATTAGMQALAVGSGAATYEAAPFLPETFRWQAAGCAAERACIPQWLLPLRPRCLCVQIAQFAAELERYPQAIKIYEDVARTCVDNNLLKYRCARGGWAWFAAAARMELHSGAAGAVCDCMKLGQRCTARQKIEIER